MNFTEKEIATIIKRTIALNYLLTTSNVEQKDWIFRNAKGLVNKSLDEKLKRFEK